MAAQKLRSRLCGLSIFLLSVPAAISTSTVDNGKLLSVNGISYYSGGNAVSSLLTSVDFNSTRFDDIVPITVIRTDETLLTKSSLSDIIANYSATDDVFQAGFLESWLSVSHNMLRLS